MQMLYERVSRLQTKSSLAFVFTRTLITSVRTVTATALAIVTHIYNMYEGFVLWLIVLGSPGFPSVSCPRHALNLLGLCDFVLLFRGQRYYE